MKALPRPTLAYLPQLPGEQYTVPWQSQTGGNVDEKTPGVGSAVLVELNRLMKVGAGPENLSRCQALHNLLKSSIDQNGVAHNICTRLLHEVLLAVADNARKDALNQLLQSEQKNSPTFQAASAATLLKLIGKNYKEEFSRVRLFVVPNDKEWEHIKAKQYNKGPRGQTLLEASVWLGTISSATTRRRIKDGTLAEAFDVALRKHLEESDTRRQVRNLLAELTPSDISMTQPLGSMVTSVPYIARSLDLETQKAVHNFAARVRRQLQTDQQANNVEDPLPIKLTWSAVTDPAIVGHNAGQRRTPETIEEIVAALSSDEPARFVFLGRGGAGKTTLATSIALALLEPRRLSDRVPVVLNVASWNPAHTALDDWVIGCLNEQYKYKEKRCKWDETPAAQLVRNGHILPILDGLDELPLLVRESAILTINGAIRDKLVVMSRPEQYQAIVAAGNSELRDATVLAIDDLNFDDVAKYLRSGSYQDHWTPIIGQADTEDAQAKQRLRDVLTTPLMAMLAKSVYSRSEQDPSELLNFSTTREIANHLLDRFVDTRFDVDHPPLRSTEMPYRDWGRGNAKVWLGLLAASLVSHRSEDFAWWKLQIAEVASPLRRPVTILLASGLTLMGISWLIDSAPLGTVGVVMFLLSPIALALGKNYLPRRWSWGSIFGVFRDGDAYTTALLGRYCIGVGFISGIALAASSDSADSGLMLLLILAFIAFSLCIFFAPALSDTAVDSPQKLLESDTRTTVTTAAIFLISLLTGSVYITLVHNDARTLLSIPALVVTASSTVLFSASGVWFTSTLGLASHNLAPRQFMRFLSDAHRLGILRQSGGTFQFLHVLLRDRLAKTYIENCITSSSFLYKELNHKLTLSRFSSSSDGSVQIELETYIEHCNLAGDLSSSADARLLLSDILRRRGALTDALDQVDLLLKDGLHGGPRLGPYSKTNLRYRGMRLRAEILRDQGKIEAARSQLAQLEGELHSAINGWFNPIQLKEEAVKFAHDLETKPIFRQDQ